MDNGFLTFEPQDPDYYTKDFSLPKQCDKCARFVKKNEKLCKKCKDKLNESR